MDIGPAVGPRDVETISVSIVGVWPVYKGSRLSISTSVSHFIVYDYRECYVFGSRK